MDTNDFEELQGQLEGLARAVLILVQTMERETNMDGLTLTRHWRESVGPQQADAGRFGTARRTLHQLAQRLDDARTRHQELLLQARLADCSPVPAVAEQHAAHR